MFRQIRFVILIFLFLSLNVNSAYGSVGAPYASLAILGSGGGNLGIPGGAAPTTPSAIDMVSTGYEFLAWMDKNESSGGKVVLSADISVYGRSSQEYFYPAKKITIDTAGHSITVKRGTFLNLNGDYLRDSANIEIVGSGSKPVIVLEDDGILSLQCIKMKTAGTNSN